MKLTPSRCDCEGPAHPTNANATVLICNRETRVDSVLSTFNHSEWSIYSGKGINVLTYLQKGVVLCWMPPESLIWMPLLNNELSAGLGVVARDSDGRVIAALSERITLPPTIEALEALACRKAVAFAIDLDIQDVVFEGDSETIFKHLSSDQPSMAAFGHLVDEARNLAATLRSFQYSHIKRVIWWHIN
ncbi:hypothetical protein SO802_024255 [Lithocarpus litseifolius]|uniref:RNase H type-1 domain-containing protein n=1 Tax=Lithocarpus litseifolius TaxID=425828 RepID=A0AAW2CAI8_9ROSI